MVGVFQRDDLSFFRSAEVAPILHGHFQRDFHRRRSVIREKNMPQRRRHDFAEPCSQFFRRLVRKAREQDMLEPRGLLADGRRNRGMRVPVQIDPPRRDRIQNSAPVSGFEKHPIAPPDGRRRGFRAIAREWMPQMEFRFTHDRFK